MKKLFTLLTLLVAIVTGAQADDATFTMSNIFDGSNQTATVTTPVAATVTTNASKSNAKDGKLGSTNNYFEVVLTSDQFTAVSINGYINSGDKSYNWGFQFSTDGGATWSEEVTQANDGDKTSHDIAVGATIPANANGFRVIRKAGSSTIVNSITFTLAGDPSDTRTNLVGAWSAATSTFDFGSTATAPTFAVTGGTATAGTDYSVAYALTTDGGNVTVNSTSGITAIDTNTPGTSKVKATITVLNETDYKATTTEYEATITVNPEQVIPTGDEYKITFNGQDVQSTAGYFTCSGNHNFNTKFNGATYDGTTFTKGLKMESSTTISFTNTATATVMIIQSTWSNTGIAFDGTTLASSTATAGTGYRVYTISDVAAGTHSITRGSASESGLFQITVIEESKTIVSQVFSGVKKDGTSLTENTDYSISGTTITLDAAYTTATAPTGYTLTNLITYDDSSTKYEDVDVTFEAAATGGYYTGTATIGETAYTVKVPVDVTPTIILSEASGSVSLNSYTVVATKTTTLTGANLTDGTYNVAADVAGVTVSPASFTVANGAVSQEFTFTTTSSTQATTVFTFSDGTNSVTYTLNYARTAKRNVTQSDVTNATRWSWANAASNDVLLTVAGTDGATADTDPKRGEDFLLGTLPEINNDATFNSQALVVNCQYAYRSGNYLQGNMVKFHTTIPGIVTVKFSNTSNRSDTPANRRYLYVNETNTDVYTLGQSFETATVAVAAGDVVINAYTGEETPVATMVRVQEITFTPTVPVTITSAGAASFSSTEALDFSAVEGITAYKATAKSDSYVHLDEVAQVPAGAGVIVKGAVGTYNVPVATGDVAELEGNLLVGTAEAEYTVGGDYGKVFKYVKRTSDNVVGFQKAQADWTCQVGHAYLKLSETPAREFIGIFDEEVVTGIDAIENGTIDNDAPAYNLAGQKVGKGYKGIVIINGKKVVK